MRLLFLALALAGGAWGLSGCDFKLPEPSPRADPRVYSAIEAGKIREELAGIRAELRRIAEAAERKPAYSLEDVGAAPATKEATR